MPHLLGIAYNALELLDWSIDWAGIPIVMEMLGIEDVESMVRLMRIVIAEERN